MSIRVPLPGLTNSETNMTEEQQIVDNTPKYPWSASKGPFATFNRWTPELLNEITIKIGEPIASKPKLGGDDKQARYWNSDITFQFGGFINEIIKVGGIEVPAMSSKNYGIEFLYAALPEFICDAICEAANKAGIKVTPNDPKIIPTNGVWWRVFNGCRNKIGIVATNGQFQPKPVNEIFSHTKQGILVNFDIVFKLRLTKNVQKGQETVTERTDDDVFVIVSECSRAALKDIEIDVIPPNLVARIATQPAARDDIAPAGMLEKLQKMGLF